MSKQVERDSPKKELLDLYENYPIIDRHFRVIIENEYIELQKRVLHNISSTPVQGVGGRAGYRSRICSGEISASLSGSRRRRGSRGRTFAFGERLARNGHLC